MAPDLRLWQMKNSIFCEKARWILDYKRLPYRTTTVTPGLHPVLMLLRRRGTTVPVLDVDGEPVRGSDAIALRVEQLAPGRPLFPADPPARRRALELQAYFDERGHDVRRVLMDPVLSQPDLVVTAFLGHERPAFQRLGRAGAPLSAPLLRRWYGIRRDRVPAAIAAVEEAFGRLEQTLDGGSFLVGGAFSIADLAAASVLGALVMPPELEFRTAPDGSLPAELEETRARLARRRGWQWVLETYRDLRRREP